jgi:hypothetical protein
MMVEILGREVHEKNATSYRLSSKKANSHVMSAKSNDLAEKAILITSSSPEHSFWLVRKHEGTFMGRVKRGL